MALVVKNLPTNAGDVRDAGSIPGLGRSLGGGHGNPLQFSCLENPMDRGAWEAIVHRVAYNLSWLKWLSMHTCKYLFTGFAAAAKLLQSCPTLCDPIDGSPSGSPVPGILQARTLEWVAISFSNAWKWKVKVKLLSCVRLFETPWTAAYQAPLSMGFSRQEYWSGVPLPSPPRTPKMSETRCWEIDIGVNPRYTFLQDAKFRGRSKLISLLNGKTKLSVALVRSDWLGHPSIWCSQYVYQRFWEAAREN